MPVWRDWINLGLIFYKKHIMIKVGSFLISQLNGKSYLGF